MDISDVLRETLHKYSTCLTYRDCGYYCEDNSDSPSIQFSTHFKRPTSVRFEWAGETRLIREGFLADTTKTTLLRCNPNGECSYFDPRNTVESKFNFASPTEMFQFDKLGSGYVAEIILPLLVTKFGAATRRIGKKSCLTMKRIDQQGPYEFCAERTYRQFFQSGIATITDTIWIDSELHIRRFRRQGLHRAADKRLGSIRTVDYQASPEVYRRYLERDSISISDYHFIESAFDEDIDDVLFCLDHVESKSSKLLMNGKV